MPKYEKTQKGNPHKLTIKQHIFPKKSIQRFTNNDDVVQVYDKKLKEIKHLKPANPFFCAMRLWNQRAESGYMKNYEDEFQKLIELALKGLITSFSPHQNETISRMYALWNCRWYRKLNPIPDQKVYGVREVANERSQDELEQLEKIGVHTIKKKKDGYYFLGRDMLDGIILQNIDMAIDVMHESDWKLVTSQHGEFVVPDTARTEILPVTPYHCLINGYHKKFISYDDLIILNNSLIAFSDQYFFARELKRCPHKLKEYSF